MSDSMIKCCLICHNRQHGERFKGWECNECGQIYAFDEGVIIQLSGEQYRVLTEHYWKTKFDGAKSNV